MTIKEIQTEIDETKADIGNFIELYKTEHTAGRYENWNCNDVVAHILEWIIFSKDKLQAIAYNRHFEEIRDIDAFNRQNWIKNKDKHIGELKKSIMFDRFTKKRFTDGFFIRIVALYDYGHRYASRFAYVVLYVKNKKI